MQTRYQIPTPEAAWLMNLLEDRDVPRPVPTSRDETVDRLRGLEETVRMLVSLIDPREVAAAIRAQEKSIDNPQLMEWARRSVPPEELAGFEEERPW